MNSFKKLHNISGWIVFAISSVVFYLSAERVGSLWDCGEFITGAYKLEVVHPPGAALFMIVGRVFTFLAEIISNNPEDISFAVNLMSGLCTAFTAMFVAWVAGILGKMALVGRTGEPDTSQNIVLAGTAIIAGLTTAFSTSIWFSAVEGEVYAMSTMFTAMTLWTMIKWYHLPDEPKNDRWVILTVYIAALSIGIHLLSLLTFPALALFYYFKKYKKHTVAGMAAAAGLGVAFIVGIQTLIIIGIPKLWGWFELMMVNGLGLPFHSGIVPLILFIGGIVYLGLRFAHQHQNALFQNLIIAAFLSVIGFSTIGVVVIRANANTPINMNNPSDPMRLIPYLNREQYGERPLLRGPNYDAKPLSSEVEERYGQLGDQYEIVDHKVSYVFNNSDKILFPRMGDYTQNRPKQYQRWLGGKKGAPNFLDNVYFFFRYQIGWMYWRYFMWNFAGRQNGDQGYYSWDKSSGHWLSGIKPLDEARLYNMDELPESRKNNQARNKYYMLPFLFGLLGLLWHFRKQPNDAMGLLALFIITGIGIIVYSNQPPNEPRERDYVLVGSFFTYAIWVGMGALALFELLREKVNLNANTAAPVAVALVMLAPLIMGFENFDDHTRRYHTGSRDYASNFLESCAPNAIIFTYGDNDTYPLWYAQEVEGIRTDVRVVNLSLIAVDWYIDQLRRKVNDSPPIKMTIPREAYRGYKRNQVLYYNPSGKDKPTSIQNFIKYIGEDHLVQGTGGRKLETMNTKNVFIPVNRQKALTHNIIGPSDTTLVNRIPLKINNNYLIKDEIAILDLIASNVWERPIYFAVTCRPEKMFGLEDYTELEGLGLEIIPVKTKSDGQYLIMGSGKVNTDAVYDNIMNKFRWGNFDQHKAFINKSYAPSIQSHRIVMLRTARVLMAEGEKEKAVELCKKYFEVFPHFNFPYDYNSMYFINLLMQGGANEEAKKQLEILAEETADQLEFFYSILDDDDFEASFQQDFSLSMRTMDEIKRAAQNLKDPALEQKFNELFAAFDLAPTENTPK